jgi:hypothetical protein
MTAIKKLGLDHGIAPKKRISEEFDPQYTWRYSQSKMLEAEISSSLYKSQFLHKLRQQTDKI